jgi:pyruvate/2-oxoglutarate/acetoin dehydrogenase E1 component
MIMQIIRSKCPTIFIENKIGYSRILHQNPDGLNISQEDFALGNIFLNSSSGAPDITIITYGELARDIADALSKIELEFQRKIELICLLQLHPIRLKSILDKRLGNMVIVVEEGSKEFGIGGEIAALLAENRRSPEVFVRVAAEGFPIASNLELEDKLLPSMKKVCAAIQEEIFHGRI